MKQHFWFKFEWQKWRTDPALRRCSLETRGFWLECLCVMYDTNDYFLEGTPSALANLIGCDPRKFARCVDELERENAASVSKSQGFIKLVSRRLLKAVNLREYNRIKQAERRCQARVKAQSKTPSKDKSSEVKSKEKNKTPPQAAVSNHSLLMKHHADRIGVITDGAAQGKAIKSLLEKFSARDAISCYSYQVSEMKPNGWRTKVNWLTVWSEISEWITAGRPEKSVKTNGQNGRLSTIDKLGEYGEVFSRYESEDSAENIH